MLQVQMWGQVYQQVRKKKTTTTKNRPGYVEKITGSLDFLRFCYGIDSIYNV